MEYKNEACSFTIPDKPTVRQQLAYVGAASGLRGAEMFLRLWEGAVDMLADWECKLIPDLEEFDLDEADNPAITEVIIWVGIQVRNHMNALDEVPKN